MLLYFLLGSLPWIDPDEPQDAPIEPLADLCQKRKRDPLVQKMLCQGLPDTFRQYMDYIRQRQSAKPDYARLRRRFKQLYRASGYVQNYEYDWTVKLYNELREAAVNEEVGRAET